MIVCFQYRLYPTSEQERVLDNTLETLCHLYNGAPAQRIDAYKHEGTTVGYVAQQNRLPLLKVTAPPLAALYSQVAQECLRRLDTAYQAFFRRVKAGDKPGFPRFKGAGRYRSFCYPAWNGSVKLLDGFIRLSKIGDSVLRLHRSLQGTPKTVVEVCLQYTSTLRRKYAGSIASVGRLAAGHLAVCFQHTENSRGFTPRCTSQNCSGCGAYVPKALSCRTHVCPYCGLVLHRDKNAAENIRKS